MFAGEDLFAEANGPADIVEQSVMIAVPPVTGIPALIERGLSPTPRMMVQWLSGIIEQVDQTVFCQDQR